jgi:2-keto-4-pentenoate hydratase/2-oxohepta-3-ene-1,7-dioic acid hydratase in catechol pathway
LKLATFEQSGKRRIGIVRDQTIFDLAVLAPGLPRTMEELLASGGEGMAVARDALQRARVGVDLAEVRLCAPIHSPRKFLAIGGNFHSHIAEVKAIRPDLPMHRHQTWFNKQVSCIVGPFDPIHLPRVSSQLDYEAEMAIVIGRRGRHVAREDAHHMIAGYCICNDVSVRDWQLRSVTGTLGKSFDTHGPIGPWITTVDEVPQPAALGIRTWVDGEQRQNGNTQEFIYSIGELIEELTTVFTLEPGDILSTGSPAGVGALMTPPNYLKAGQKVRIEIDLLGQIENLVIDEPPFKPI